MPEPLWKKVQRKHHELLGGQGRVKWRYESGADSNPLPWLVVESKQVKRIPSYLGKALKQARDEAAAGQLGIAVFHQTGEFYHNDLVLMTLGDFIKFFEGWAPPLP